MTLTQIVILAVVQGLAELLPVSSSAHVIAIARLMGIKDTSSPEFVLMLVMLHTGTMFAVIVYFWSGWKKAFFSSTTEFTRFATKVVVATGITGVIYLGIKEVIKWYLKHKDPSNAKPEVEELFKHLEFLAIALAAVGVLILYAGIRSSKGRARKSITTADSIAIGAIQGVCLPFRGFSRSGATISVGLIRGMARVRLEQFSFALAVVITPPAILVEAHRFMKKRAELGIVHRLNFDDFAPHLLGMGCSFLAGLIALKVLSKLLEKGQWWLFGVYCLLASAGIYKMYLLHY